MNKIFLTGRLTRNVNLTENKNGIPVCDFGLAVKRNYPNAKGDYDSDFFEIVVWFGNAEKCAKYLEKGDKIQVIGTAQTKWIEIGDKKPVKTLKTYIIASEVEFIEWGKNNPQNEIKGFRIINKAESEELPF